MYVCTCVCVYVCMCVCACVRATWCIASVLRGGCRWKDGLHRAATGMLLRAVSSPGLFARLLGESGWLLQIFMEVPANAVLPSVARDGWGMTGNASFP